MRSVNIITRGAYDEFSFNIFMSILGDVDKDYDAVYIWPPAFINKKLLINKNFLFYLKEFVFKNDLIILGIKDHLVHNWKNLQEYNAPTVWDYFEEIFSLYPTKHFIVFTSVENLKSKYSNVKIISWGGDVTNQKKEYISLENNIIKNFNSNFSYISLNNTRRDHRELSLIVQFSLNVHKFGIITYNHNHSLKESDNIDGVVPNKNTSFYKFLMGGLSKIKNHTFNDFDLIYPSNNNDNVSNFKNNLINYYNEVFVEIVAETTFNEPFMFTEKILNSIYGCNFPIILSNVGAVEHLRKMGMDVFDDIIDHSYDREEESTHRIFSAFYKNKKILTNPDLVKKLWIKNQDRFLANIEFAKKNLYDFYLNRTMNEWKKLKYLYSREK